MIGQQAAQAVGEERLQGIRGIGFAIHWLMRHCGGECNTQIQGLLGFEQDAQHAQCSATQAQRVAVAGGAIAQCELAGEGVQFVGQGQHAAGRRGGNGVGGAARLVVLGNGAGNGFGFTGLAGVVAADDAFELGELEHHVGDQVGLGQCGGARGGVGIRAQGFGQRGGQGF